MISPEGKPVSINNFNKHLGGSKVKRSRLAFATGMVILAISACQSPGSNGNQIQNTSHATESSDTLLSAEWTLGPLEEFMVRIYGTPQFGSGAELMAALEAAHLEAEELIAACMQSKGFDYVINPSSGISVWDGSTIEFTVPYSTRSWAEVYGFGLNHPSQVSATTSPDEGHHWAPNEDLLSLMTQAEREAWLYALYGPPHFGNLQPGSCFGDAQANLFWRSEADNTGFESLSEEVHNFRSSIMWLNDHPAFSELDLSWQQCMSNEGLNLGDSRNPMELAEFLRQEAFQYLTAISRDQAETAAEVRRRDRELEFAVANWDCRHSLDYDARRRSIEIELEREFVERHYEELEAWAISEEQRRVPMR
jgi:hypothetical protein